MEFAAGARVALRPPTASGSLTVRNPRVGGGAIRIGWSRRAAAPKLSLPPAAAKRAVSAAGGGGHLLPRPRRVVVRSTVGDSGGFRGEDTEGDRSSPPDVAKGANAAR